MLKISKLRYNWEVSFLNLIKNLSKMNKFIKTIFPFIVWIGLLFMFLYLVTISIK